VPPEKNPREATKVQVAFFCVILSFGSMGIRPIPIRKADGIRVVSERSGSTWHDTKNARKPWHFPIIPKIT
jgi:hypothetical protein